MEGREEGRKNRRKEGHEVRCWEGSKERRKLSVKCWKIGRKEEKEENNEGGSKKGGREVEREVRYCKGESYQRPLDTKASRSARLKCSTLD